MFGIRMLAGILGFGIVLNGAAGAAHKTLLQQGIAEEVLRFHVLANSDSEGDQEVKLKVRDAVLEWAESMFRNTAKNHVQDDKKEHDEDEENRFTGMKNKKEILDLLEQYLSEIEELAENVLQDQGYDYEASAKIQTCYFPDRTYRDCTFPSGWYDALRIELGEAQGQNWWCVFYPRLCFADYLHVVSDKESTEMTPNETLEQILTVEEYELLLKDPGEWEIGFRWF